MEHDNVVSGLVRKRGEIAGHIDATQDRLRQLQNDLAHVDATIRMFRPDINLSGVKVRAVAGHHAALYGEMTRAILAVLRPADRPLTLKEIGEGVMDARGLSKEDGALVKSINDRVGSALRNMKRRGSVQCERGDGLALVWAVVEDQ